jgi:hypothetical protein
MVFGSTYCLLSHLEIKEGDEFYCFEIKQSSVINWGDIFIFDFERLKTNNFLPKLVTWNGNYYSVKDKNKLGDYFLIHKKFYDYLIKEDFNFTYTNQLPHIIFCYEVRHNYISLYEKEKRNELKRLKNEINKDSYLFNYLNIEIPENIKNIYKLSFFMNKMGIRLFPNISNDQHNFGEIYQNILKKCQ